MQNKRYLKANLNSELFPKETFEQTTFTTYKILTTASSQIHISYKTLVSTYYLAAIAYYYMILVSRAGHRGVSAPPF